jgi:hypothetical protein
MAVIGLVAVAVLITIALCVVAILSVVLNASDAPTVSGCFSSSVGRSKGSSGSWSTCSGVGAAMTTRTRDDQRTSVG